MIALTDIKLVVIQSQLTRLLKADLRGPNTKLAKRTSLFSKQKLFSDESSQGGAPPSKDSVSQSVEIEFPPPFLEKKVYKQIGLFYAQWEIMKKLDIFDILGNQCHSDFRPRQVHKEA